MLILLFLCSLICIAAGAAMIAYGIPVKEFSFGDTLITDGVIAVVGGLLLGGIGFAVVHLQRIMDALAARPMRSARPSEAFEPHVAAGARVSRASFPPRPRSERRPFDASAADSEASIAAGLPADENLNHSIPTLRNPDEPPTFSEDARASLSSQEVSAPPLAQGPMETPAETKQTPGSTAREPADDAHTEAETTENREHGGDWRPLTPSGRQPQSTFFDAMWPAEKRLAKAATREEPYGAAPEADRAPKPADSPPVTDSGSARSASAPGERRTVAILKSGVVDGMGYTLYVDGSIEAELPDGKLRFASINELRSYLEKH